MDICSGEAERSLQTIRQGGAVRSLGKQVAVWIGCVLGGICGCTAVSGLAASQNPTSSNYLPAVIFLAGVVLVPILVSAVMVNNAKVKRQPFGTLLQAYYDAKYWHGRCLEQAQKTHQSRVTTAQAHYEQDLNTSIQTYKQQIDQLRPALASINSTIEQDLPTWSDPAWNSWTPGALASPVPRLGTWHASLRQEKFSSPALFPFPGERSLIFEATGSAKATVVQAIQSVLLQLLATVPPGKLQFTFLDPLGLGKNVAPFLQLADDDEKLVTSKAWTESQHIEQRLADLTEQMETVIQKYLRNQYQTIEDYNKQAEEIEEPYRVLVALDFPTNFSETSARRLQSIAANGPRCGVYTILLIDTAQALPYGFNQADLENTGMVIVLADDHFVCKDHDFDGYVIELDGPPENSRFQQILKEVGQQARVANEVRVRFVKMFSIFDDQLISRPNDYPGITKPISPLHPGTWWVGETSRALIAPLGRTGANKVQCLNLGRDIAPHILVVGKTGSGKSTLLHTLITSIALTYSPDEVELYLIDFKEGVEFKTYASAQLPHARVIAIESEREFGLSVLQGLEEELKFRGTLFKEFEGQERNLAIYRQRTGKGLPRILLVVDEFQKFFTEDDAIASQAARILDNLTRQGRSFGIHIMLASQSLAGAYTLARSTIDQMGVRIALQCSEADSRLILADDNHEARLLNRPGEAIYNDQNGRIEGNTRFQVAWLTEEEHISYLEEVTAKAQQVDSLSRDQIIFEGNTAAQVEKKKDLFLTLTASMPINTAVKAPQAWLGDPIAIKNPPLTTVQFRPQSGDNLLIVGHQEKEALGMFITCFTSLLAQYAPQAVQFHLIDFPSMDSPHAGLLEQLGQLFPNIQFTRRSDLALLINRIATEVDRRIDTEEQGLPSIYLGIFGLQRARRLRQEDDFSFSGSEAAEPNPSRQFTHILREGPDLKVHTIAWCDTLNNLNRTLERRALREFGMRAVFQMSADDSSSLIDTPLASKLGENRALLFVEEQGRLEKFRPFDIPSQDWLKALSASISA
jgi:S-DNA-T family DNA segregation ATPase FtsK/SpoIIIE